MRIAAITTLASGGATIAAARITKALADVGHECAFFILSGAENSFFTPLSGTAENDTLDAFWLDAIMSRGGALCHPEAFKGGAEFFSDTFVGLHPFMPLPEAVRNADVIHLHWMAGILFSPALLQAFQGKKVVWTLHDMNAFTGGCHYHPTCRKFETRCEECPMLRISDKYDASSRGFELKNVLYPFLSPTIVCPSKWLADEARSSALLRNFTVKELQNCCDLNTFTPKDRTELRARFSLRHDSLVLLIAADRLTSLRKNTQLFWDALRLLGADDASMNIEVLAFGHGTIPPAPFPVHFLGQLKDEASTADAYAAADIYVHTALMDNLPNTLCEAQCCGTPVLSFAIGGCPETMIPGKTGFLVKECTAEAMAAELKKIYCNRKVLAPMREAARIFATAHFDPQKIASAYVELFAHAVPAQTFGEHSQLFTTLLQNQMASLADVVADNINSLADPEHLFSQLNEHVLDMAEHHLLDKELLMAYEQQLHKCLMPQNEHLDRMADIERTLLEIIEVQNIFKNSLQNLQHPFRSLFRKLWRRAKS